MKPPRPRPTLLRLLHDATKEIGVLVSEEDILDAATRKAHDLFGAASLLLLRAEDGGRWEPRASVGVPVTEGLPCLDGAHVDQHCLVHARRALKLVDVAPDADVPAAGAYATYSFAPLEAGGGVLGLLGVELSSGDPEPETLELLCALAAVSATALEQARLRQRAVAEERRRLRLARYFSPQAAEHLLSEGADGLRCGLRCEATVLFSDVRGFTSISDRLDPACVLEILNCYFSEVTQLVFEHGGMIDKLIGDGMLAVFGTPKPLPNHALSAIRCASSMQAAVERMDFSRFGVDRFEIGVGLHTGPVLLGDLGGDAFLDFTVLGGTVNLASRVEGLTKDLGAPVLLTESVRAAAGDGRVRTSPVGPQSVRGVSQQVQLHRLIGLGQPE